MSWGAQNRSKDTKAPSAAGGRSEKPELDLWPVQQYAIRRGRPQGACRALRALSLRPGAGQIAGVSPVTPESSWKLVLRWRLWLCLVAATGATATTTADSS
jgi:hypothetical protein